MGFKGPRKMTIVIPGMSSDHHRVEVQPRNVRKSNIDFSFDIYLSSSKDSESLIERWKHNEMGNLLELHNKTPVWNEGKQSNIFLFIRRNLFQRNAIICT